MSTTASRRAAGSTGAAISVQDVSKKFRIFHERNQTLKSAIMRGRRSVHEDFWALRDVTFDIPEAGTFALVGDNGSGKSTLLKCMAQILYPTSGRIVTRGRMAALLEVGSGFHPELSGRDNVYLNGSILGMTKPEIDRKFDEIVAFSGVEQFIDQPVKNYSSGMYVRLGFSVAINVDPEILLVDEVLAVGDAAFQEKCGEKFAQFRREGRTVVLVSHSMPQLRTMADQAAWLEQGRLMEVGSANGVLERYLDSTRDTTRLDEQGRSHWGSGEMVVEDVEVIGAAGPGSPVRTGEDLTIRVHYRATEPVENPVIGVGIESTDGTYLWASNTFDHGPRLGTVRGRGYVECHAPAVAFAPGGYVVITTLTDATTQHVYDQVRDSARFSVESGEQRWWGGYIHTGSRWAAPNRVGAGPAR
ncbi:ABC transporter ATP-binding protein [Georgenia sp. TF02-10]|uniref:ABC transporter ATP-binding protein n=1 Tax=Georgenia sp. TF02-10 TaxID=2917725 RepID=UPI001FA72D34|nr:ABC transporter ATP-binding protein [Georgenia sp. TF02-10]UNX55748.1 ABC transporter ATP-binding protein [Georgenia sp. TF02-10]